MKILELGNYIAPAYAGMILAEQGHYVEKWHIGKDPILSLNHGAELWQWINYKKELMVKNIAALLQEDLSCFDIVIDNFLASTLKKHDIDPQKLSKQFGLRWVSLRSEDNNRSFDLIAQCKSWMEYSDWVPFYVGDTTAGLWIAFKALAVQSTGHYVLGQATCMQKLVEGELCVIPKREKQSIPWDTDCYRFNDLTNQAEINYKGEDITETVKDTEWKLNNLWHDNGRMAI